MEHGDLQNAWLGVMTISDPLFTYDLFKTQVI